MSGMIQLKWLVFWSFILRYNQCGQPSCLNLNFQRALQEGVYRTTKFKLGQDEVHVVSSNRSYCLKKYEAFGQLCSKIANGVDPFPKEVPLDVALTLKQYLEIGDTKYSNCNPLVLIWD